MIKTSYASFIQKYLKAQYIILNFDNLNDLTPHKRLILRHDIDFDCGLALQMAEIESELNIKSSYFFLLRSSLYNLLSKDSAMLVKSIKNLGHHISLHFDPTLYDDHEKGLIEEINIFESVFSTKVNIISFHRPPRNFINNDNLIAGTEHTYMNKYMKDLKYISDSQGSFKHGDPFETDAFKEKKSTQLLIHPIWWTTEGNSNINKLNNFISQRVVPNYQEAVGNNCIPYGKYLKENA